MTAVYRFQQGVRALLAFARPLEIALAEVYLNPAQMALFKRMKRSEQLHSLNVLRDVLSQGETPHELAVAALLHDVGKIRYPLAVWQKTLVVLVRKFRPALYARLCQRDPRNPFTRGFVVSEHHPAWGAQLVAPTGASDTTLWLIAHHAERHPDAPLLARLQWADDRN